jgi:hypothetical protein
MNGRKAILCVDDEVVILVSILQELKRAFGGRFVYGQATHAVQALETIEDWLPRISGSSYHSDAHSRLKGDVFLEADPRAHRKFARS